MPGTPAWHTLGYVWGVGSGPRRDGLDRAHVPSPPFPGPAVSEVSTKRPTRPCSGRRQRWAVRGFIGRVRDRNWACPDVVVGSQDGLILLQCLATPSRSRLAPACHASVVLCHTASAAWSSARQECFYGPAAEGAFPIAGRPLDSRQFQILLDGRPAYRRRWRFISAIISASIRCVSCLENSASVAKYSRVSFETRPRSGGDGDAAECITTD